MSKKKWTLEDVQRHNAKMFGNSEQLDKSAKKKKFNNQEMVVEGIKFHSKKEGNRYQELLLMAKVGVITDLRLQVAFPVVGLRQGRKGHYIADFVYLHRDEGYVVEDVKGFKTAVYNLKKKLMKDLWNINIKET